MAITVKPHPLVVEVVALSDFGAHPFDAGVRINESRRQGARNVVRFTHAVIPREFIGLKELTETCFLGARVVQRNGVLATAVRDVGVKETRFKGLHRIAAEKRQIAFENEPGVRRKDGNRAAHAVVVALQILVIERILRGDEFGLGVKEPTGAAHGVTHRGVSDVTVAVDAGAAGVARFMPVARGFEMRRKFETPEISDVRIPIELRFAGVGTAQIIDFQCLMLIDAQRSVPILTAVRGPVVLRDDVVARGTDVACEIIDVVLVAHAVVVDAVAETVPGALHVGL